MARIDSTDWRLARGFVPPIVQDDPPPRLSVNAEWPEIARIPRVPSLGLQLGTHEPQLKLANYLDRATAQPPAAVSRPHPGFQWGMLANDRLGLCVIAMMLHSIEDWYLDRGETPPPFTPEDAIEMYSAIAGYDPTQTQPDGSNPTDAGTNEGSAMEYWQHTGLGVEGEHRIAGTIAINPRDLTEMRIGIDEFATVQLGVALPSSAQGQTEWDVVGNPRKDPTSEPGSWGGHGVPAREFDANHFKVVTWGAELLETVAFHEAYCDEAHVVVSKEMLDRTGVGPSGVQWDDLVSDMKKFASESTEDEGASKPSSRSKRRGKAKPRAEAEEAESGSEDASEAPEGDPEGENAPETEDEAPRDEDPSSEEDHTEGEQHAADGEPSDPDQDEPKES